MKRTAEWVDAPGAPARGVRLTARGPAKVARVMLLVDKARQTPTSTRISIRKSKLTSAQFVDPTFSYVAKVDRKYLPPR